jgi:hypothetical protein
MSLSSPTSLIPIAVIIGFVVWAVWIQVRARRREKRAIAASEEVRSPLRPDPVAESRYGPDMIANNLRSKLGRGGR